MGKEQVGQNIIRATNEPSLLLLQSNSLLQPQAHMLPREAKCLHTKRILAKVFESSLKTSNAHEGCVSGVTGLMVRLLLMEMLRVNCSCNGFPVTE